MAITKETTVQRIEVYPDGRLMVVYTDKFDDPDDDLLPHTSQRIINIDRVGHSIDEDGVMHTTTPDLSNHAPLVQTIAAAIWAD